MAENPQRLTSLDDRYFWHSFLFVRDILRLVSLKSAVQPIGASKSEKRDFKKRNLQQSKRKKNDLLSLNVKCLMECKNYFHGYIFLKAIKVGILLL